MTKGRLHVRTIPIAGDIYINNEYRGTNDINIEADPGIYNITFGDILDYIAPQPVNTTVDAGFETYIEREYQHI